MKSLEKLYKVIWIVNGVVKETVAVNKPRALANWIKTDKARSSHKTGKLLVLPMEDYK